MNSNKKTARIAGLMNLMIALGAPFSIIYMPSKLIVLGDAAKTAGNIMASGMLFRTAAISAIIVHMIQILFVLLLYKLLKPVHKNSALLMLILSLTGVSVAMFNEINQFAVLLLLNGSDYLKAFNAGQLYAQAMFFLNLHSYGVLIAQIFWGLWLFPLSYLVIKSDNFPKILGILLIVSGVGYLVDCFGKLLLTDYKITVSMFTFIGELLFSLWLVIVGVKEQSE